MEKALVRTNSDPGHRGAQEAQERLYTIGDMARAYNVTLRALRFYEDRGLIKPIRHGVSRFYDSASRARLETILRGKQLGFTLTQIFTMLPTENDETPVEKLALEERQVVDQLAQLERKRDEIDGAIAALRDTHRQMTGQSANVNAA